MRIVLFVLCVAFAACDDDTTMDVPHQDLGMPRDLSQPVDLRLCDPDAGVHICDPLVSHACCAPCEMTEPTQAGISCDRPGLVCVYEDINWICGTDGIPCVSQGYSCDHSDGG